ncbi:MAG: T9SS type A sorting domain-containing protein, partial [Saprospiraceae bacterium]
MKKLFLSFVLAVMFINLAAAQEKILWGGPGSKDGEFDGGLNGWTAAGVSSSDPTKTANALWTWSELAKSVGLYAGAAGLESASKANGAAIFDSDFLDTGKQAQGKGTCPAPHSGDLISPTIDVTGYNNLTVVFSQYFRNFRSNRPNVAGLATASTAIMYSRDNGATWSDPVAIGVNELVKTNQLNTTYSPTVVTRVQLPGAGNTKNFKFKFSFDGNYYFWVVDDVAIVPMEDNNLTANPNFFAPAENIFTPISQTRETYFLNDISNIGAKSQYNVKHNMNIYQLNANGQIVPPAVFTDVLNYGTVRPDTTIENKVFPNGFAPTGPKANYGAIYELLSDSTDIETWNNRLSFVFGVSDSTFAKDNGRSRSVAPVITAGSTPTWGYGNVYYIKNGKNYQSSSVTFGIEGAANNKDENLDILLYKWEPTDAADKEIDEEELVVVGDASYKIKGTEAAVPNGSGGPIRIRFNNFLSAGKPIALQDNTFYVVYIEHKGTSTDKPAFLSAYDRYNYAAVDIAFDSIGKRSFHSVLKIADRFISGGFSSLVPVIRWNIRTIVNSNEALLPSSSVNIGPNPAADFLNVKFNFESAMEAVEIIVSDVNGREMMESNFSNIQNDNFSLDVSALQAGLYNILVRTEKGA